MKGATPRRRLLKRITLGLGALAGVLVAWRNFPTVRRYARIKRM